MALPTFTDDRNLAVWDDTLHVSVWDTTDRTIRSRTVEEFRSRVGYKPDSLDCIEGSFLRIYYMVNTSDKAALYRVDKSGNMTFHSALENALMAPDEKEIFFIYTYGRKISAGCYRPYNLDSLIQRGHEIIRDP